MVLKKKYKILKRFMQIFRIMLDTLGCHIFPRVILFYFILIFFPFCYGD